MTTPARGTSLPLNDPYLSNLRFPFDRETPPPAGFWERIGAYLIDALLLFVIWAGPQWVLQRLYGPLIPSLLGMLLDLLYFTVLWTRYQQTLGYALLNLRLTRTDGRPIHWIRALVRTLLMTLGVSLAIFGVTFLGVAVFELIWFHNGAGTVTALLTLVVGVIGLVDILFIRFDARRRTLHDRMCGTMVIQSGRRRSDYPPLGIPYEGY